MHYAATCTALHLHNIKLGSYKKCHIFFSRISSFFDFILSFQLWNIFIYYQKKLPNPWIQTPGYKPLDTNPRLQISNSFYFPYFFHATASSSCILIQWRRLSILILISSKLSTRMETFKHGNTSNQQLTASMCLLVNL